MSMDKLKKYTRLYRLFVAQYLKTLMQSKVDFIIGLLGYLLLQSCGIISLALIFNQIPKLNGWDFNQLLFIYGFAQIPRGIDHLLTDNVWMISFRMVIRGEFDRYLLRPMNPFFQLISDKFQPDALGELMMGFLLIGLSIQKGIVEVTPLNVLLFVISIGAGALIYTDIKLFFASLAFWVKNSGGILQLAYNMSDFAKYPVSIYSKPIQLILSTIVPFAFVAFYPASYFLTGEAALKLIGVEVLIALAGWGIAYATFNKGISIYESAGN